MRIIRIFPRNTAVTPIDAWATVARPPSMFDEADEVHISVAFTWDLPLAERLEKLWRHVAPVNIGGPALNDFGGEFVPGMYTKKGYVMTSRGCPNHCWFCSVWKREGRIVREYHITEGYNLLDSNILACSDDHIKAVFKMLEAGKKKYHKPVEFSGGLEAARLKQWHVEELRKLRPKQMFFAYDTPDDLSPLQRAGKMLLNAGWTTASHTLRAYVLCGYDGDTFDLATQRMKQTSDAGFMPSAMLYRDDKNRKQDSEWMKWRRAWMRPAIIATHFQTKRGATS